MSIKLSYMPSDPTKEMFLVALHNIALDKKSQKEILKKGNTDIRPKFGNTFISKIIFNIKLFSHLLFRLPIYFCVIVYLIKKGSVPTAKDRLNLRILAALYENADPNKAISRAIIRVMVVLQLIAYAYLLLRVPMYLFVVIYVIKKYETELDILGLYQTKIKAIYLTLGGGVAFLFYKFEKTAEEWIAFIITKSFWLRSMNDIHRSCIEHNEWWDTSMGRIEYRNIMKECPGIISPYETIQRKMLFCKNHSASMSDADYKDSNVIHCWHLNVFSIIDDRLRQANLESLTNKTLCNTCKDILNDAESLQQIDLL